MEIHCDKCGRVVGTNLEELRHNGTYMSLKLSISGIPWDVVCRKCLEKEPRITFNPKTL